MSDNLYTQIVEKMKKHENSKEKENYEECFTTFEQSKMLAKLEFPKGEKLYGYDRKGNFCSYKEDEHPTDSHFYDDSEEKRQETISYEAYRISNVVKWLHKKYGYFLSPGVVKTNGKISYYCKLYFIDEDIDWSYSVMESFDDPEKAISEEINRVLKILIKNKE